MVTSPVPPLHMTLSSLLSPASSMSESHYGFLNVTVSSFRPGSSEWPLLPAYACFQCCLPRRCLLSACPAPAFSSSLSTGVPAFPTEFLPPACFSSHSCCLPLPPTFGRRVCVFCLHFSYPTSGLKHYLQGPQSKSIPTAVLLAQLLGFSLFGCVFPASLFLPLIGGAPWALPSAPSLPLPPLSLCLYFCLLPSLCSEALCGSVPFFWSNPGPTALAALPLLHPSHAPSKTRTTSGVTPHLPHVHFVCSSTSGSPAQTFLSVLIATRSRRHLFLHPALYTSVCRSLLKTSQLSAVSLWHSLANSPCPTVPFLAPRTGLPHIAYWPLVSLGLLTLLAQKLCQLEVFGGMNRSFWSPVLEQEQDHLVTLGK